MAQAFSLWAINSKIVDPELQFGNLKRGRFRYFPVVPGRMEFSIALRRLLLEERPPLIAVELPGFLASAYHQALERLPQMSAILYMEEDGDGDRAVYVPVEPADPFTEALRTAQELGSEVVFLEPDSNERPHLPDAYPDTYAIQRIGLENISSPTGCGRRQAPMKPRPTRPRWRGSCKARTLRSRWS